MQAEKSKQTKPEGIKKKAIRKAKRTSAANKGGAHKRIYKIHTKPRFYSPRVLQTKAAPKYARHTSSAIGDTNNFNKYSILLNPLATEKAMRKMETENTLVYIVDNRSSKHQIKEAFKRIHNIVPRKINTLLRSDGKKKAYVRLPPEKQALDVANKMGLI